LAISGNFETLSVAEVLEFVSFNRKSGKLTLSRREDQAVVVFREGRILYAAAGGVRDTLGNILVRRRLVDEPTLLEALDRQARAPQETRLGTVLIGMGAVSPEDLEAVVRDQAEAVIATLLTWSSGFFRFESIDLERHDEIEVDASDLLSSGGFSANQILIDLAQRFPEPGSPQEAEGPKSLGHLLEQNVPIKLGAETTLPALRAASRRIKRGMLLTVHANEIRVVGQYGDWLQKSVPPGTRFPVPSASLLAETLARRESIQGPPRDGDLLFLARYGSLVPRRIVLIPIPVAGVVRLLFCGDNAPGEESFGNLEEVEAAMEELGLSLEREALATRRRQVEFRAARD
jgi:hypothetical protein